MEEKRQSCVTLASTIVCYYCDRSLNQTVDVKDRNEKKNSPVQGWF